MLKLPRVARGSGTPNASLSDDNRLNWCGWVLLTELPKYLNSALGFDLTASGLISDLPPTANAVGSLVFALLADYAISSGAVSVHNTRRLMNCCGAAVQGFCLACIPFCASTKIIIALLATSQLASGATNSGVFSNIFDIAPRTCGVLTGFTNCVGMSQGIISPMVTAFILARAAHNSGSASDGGTGSASQDGGAAAWTGVWFIASALAFLSATSFLLVSTGESIEDRWIHSEASDSNDSGYLGEQYEGKPSSARSRYNTSINSSTQ
jgi:hypothetical protein